MAKCNIDIRETPLAGCQAQCGRELEVGSKGSNHTQFHRVLGRLGLRSSLRRDIRGYIKINVSSYPFLVIKFVGRDGLKISPVRLLKQ